MLKLFNTDIATIIYYQEENDFVTLMHLINGFNIIFYTNALTVYLKDGSLLMAIHMVTN